MPTVKKWLEAALHIPALSRALHCDKLDIFNQPNKTEISPDLLLQPGKITVLNVHNLDKNRRRVVVLYVQQILNRSRKGVTIKIILQYFTLFF